MCIRDSGKGTPDGSATVPLTDCCAEAKEPTKNNKLKTLFLKNESVFPRALKMPK